MRGYLCERKAGWDTHGLPVEVEVCKELGIHSKEEIEAYGIEPFIQKCQRERLALHAGVGAADRADRLLDPARRGLCHLSSELCRKRLGVAEELFDRGLLYQGHKIVWWWAQGGTALSAGEVGQGYREVADPSVYVLFPLLDDAGKARLDETDLLVWTTTPWTLPSNQFAAVHPDLEYAVVSRWRDESTIG